MILSIAAAVVGAAHATVTAVNKKKIEKIIGAYRFRQGKENNVCKDVWVGTVKIPKKINANNDVENFGDYAIAA